MIMGLSIPKNKSMKQDIYLQDAIAINLGLPS